MDNKRFRVYLYGLDDEYRVIRYAYIPNDEVTIWELKFQASILNLEFPNITSVWAVDNDYEIYLACRDSMKTNLVEDRVVFKIMLEQYGVKLT